MDRKPMLAGNWKMHKTIEEAIDLTVRLKYACESLDDRDAVVCPPFTALQAVTETLSDSDIEVGAQDMHYEESGAFTGEVSPEMVTDTGSEWVILGHSERREYFGEDAEILRRKMKAAIDHDLKIFYCIGEDEQQRENGEVEAVIQRQLESVLADFSIDQFPELVVAYEPLWAIGSGNPATPEQANDAHRTVRETLADLYNDSVGEQTRVVYGGSVKPHNVAEIMEQPHLDGALVGSASLSAEDFASIIKYDQEETELPSV
ncbi:MAG: triose-phosphate isomerase [bacterium]